LDFSENNLLKHWQIKHLHLYQCVCDAKRFLWSNPCAFANSVLWHIDCQRNDVQYQTIAELEAAAGLTLLTSLLPKAGAA
jgi:hypothetical protein